MSLQASLRLRTLTAKASSFKGASCFRVAVDLGRYGFKSFGLRNAKLLRVCLGPIWGIHGTRGSASSRDVATVTSGPE